MKQPVIYDLAIDYARFGATWGQASAILGHKFPGRAGARPRCIVLHIQDGTTRGTLSYWPGVQASSTVLIQRDGSILRVIPESDGPWTNGDVIDPTPQSLIVRNLGGNPNVWTLSIEAEGHPFDPLPAVQLDAIEWQCRDWMTRYPEITSPLWVLPHRSFNSATRGNCPGPAGNSYYEAIVKRLAGGTTTAYATADVPDAVIAALMAGRDAKLGRETVYACRRRWTVARATPRRKYAEIGAKKIGPDLRPGESFEGLGVFENDSGWWTLTEFGTRIRLADCDPAFPFVEAA